MVQAVSPGPCFQKFTNELTNCLFCPPYPWPGFLAWFFLSCSGVFPGDQPDPPPPGRTSPPPTCPNCGGGSPREGVSCAWWPEQPPRQDQTWQSPRSRLGTGRGNWQTGAALPGRVMGTASATTHWLQQPPTQIRSDSVGAVGSGRQPEGSSGVALGAQERSPPTAYALDPALGLSGPGQTPAWENPGPFPGAAALPGRAGGGDSRNLPGDRRRVTGQNPPFYGQRFRCVSWESPSARGGTRPRLRPARLAPRHPAPRCWKVGVESPPWTFQTPGSEDAWRVGRPSWDCEVPGQNERGDTDTRANNKQQWSGGSPILSSLRPPGLEKKDNRN